MTIYRFGLVTVEVGSGFTHIQWPDGKKLWTPHDPQPGQQDRAKQLGYATARAMNRDHDLVHCMLAHWLGLPHSPTLRAVAEGRYWSQWQVEEGAVLAIQHLANVTGADLMTVAKRYR